MQRRDFLKKASVGAVAGASATLAAPAIAQAQPTVKWRLTSSFPKSLDTIYASADHLANRVRELTGGKFDIRVFPGGEIVPAGQALDAVQAGTVECCHTISNYYNGKNKAFAFSAIPFGMNTRQATAWLYQGGGNELLNEFYAKYNVISFLGGGTGAQMAGWYRKELKSLEDMKGLKMRIAGLGGEVFAAMGAIPQQIPAGDTYAALEKGAIDAVEWIGPYDDEKLGFDKVAKHYYYPAFWEPGSFSHFFVNKDEWAKLPKEYQAAFEVASYEAAAKMIAAYDTKNPAALARLLQKGVKLQKFPDEVMQAGYKAAFQIYNDEAATNPDFKKIFTEYDKFRRSSNAWFSVAEMNIDRFLQSAK